jgi:hypothetical protein
MSPLFVNNVPNTITHPQRKSSLDDIMCKCNPEVPTKPIAVFSTLFEWLVLPEPRFALLSVSTEKFIKVDPRALSILYQ